MPNLVSRMKQEKFVLVANLHINDTKLALSAEEGGCDAVLVNVNSEETSGSSRSGSFALEEVYIRDVLSSIKIPVGICLGDTRLLEIEEWESILNLGLDFVKMYAHQMPLYVLQDSRISKIVSIGTGYLLEQVKTVSECENVDALEAAIIPQPAQGLYFNVLDVATINILTNLSSKPILIPTQKIIRPSEVKIIQALGCKGILVGKTVLGTTPESYKIAVPDFRQAIEALPKWRIHL